MVLYSHFSLFLTHTYTHLYVYISFYHVSLCFYEGEYQGTVMLIIFPKCFFVPRFDNWFLSSSIWWSPSFSFFHPSLPLKIVMLIVVCVCGGGVWFYDTKMNDTRFLSARISLCLGVNVCCFCAYNCCNKCYLKWFRFLDEEEMGNSRTLPKQWCISKYEEKKMGNKNYSRNNHTTWVFSLSYS